MSKIITKKQFESCLKEKLGEHFKRALDIFEKYRERLSWDVTNVLLHACEKGKVEEVLHQLESHYEGHLQFQHPELWANVEDAVLGINDTELLFNKICVDTLQLQAG